MNKLPKSWISLSLSDAVINISITDKKIPQKNYLSEGSYAIFDQGQDYLGGYTDKKEKLIECELPIIIFGDHTRVVKLVNRPFAPGADGVKVLQPQRFYDPKLLEYFIRHIAMHLTSHGYARHYQHLVKSEIPLPPLNEQHRIVTKIEELFSELDKGIENLKTAQSQLKVYRQALLKHAFEGKLTAQWRAERHAKQSVAPAKAGAQPLNDMDSRLPPAFARVTGNDKPLETADTLLKRIQQERAQRYQQQLADWEFSGKQGSKPKPPKTLPPLSAEELAELPELPEGWVYSYLADLGDLGRGKSKHRPRNDPRLFGGVYPFIQTGEVKSANRIIRQYSQTYSDFGLQQSKLWPTGTLCITIAANIAETAFLGFNGCFPDSVVGFSAFKKIILPEYVDFFIQAARMRIEAYAPATAQKNINLETLENLVVPYCYLAEQKQILNILEERFSVIDQLDQTITTALQQAEALRQSILKKAFSGQLVPQDPNDEPASELLARIRAERDAPSAKPKLTNTTRKSL